MRMTAELCFMEVPMFLLRFYCNTEESDEATDVSLPSQALMPELYAYAAMVLPYMCRVINL